MQIAVGSLQEAEEVVSFRRIGPTGSRASVRLSAALWMAGLC